MIRLRSWRRTLRLLALIAGDCVIAAAAVVAAVEFRRRIAVPGTESLLPPAKFPLDAVNVGASIVTLIVALAANGFYAQRITVRHRPMMMVALLIQVALLTLASTLLQRPYPRTILFAQPLLESALLVMWRRVFARGEAASGRANRRKFRTMISRSAANPWSRSPPVGGGIRSSVARPAWRDGTGPGVIRLRNDGSDEAPLRSKLHLCVVGVARFPDPSALDRHVAVRQGSVNEGAVASRSRATHSPVSMAAWRLRHPLRFARSILPFLIPLGWRAWLLSRFGRERRTASQWGEPAEWLRELEALPSSRREASSDAPLVSVHVVAHRNPVMTALCVGALLRLTEYERFEVIVIDNASDDGTAKVLREISDDPRLKRIFRADNAGFAAACNEAVASSSGEVICILNNDVVVSRGWLRALVRELQRGDHVGLVGPVTNRCGNEAQVSVSYRSLAEMLEMAEWRRRRPESFEIPMLALFCAAAWRKTWEAIGPLDEQFLVGMFEDDDYCHRLRQRHYSILCVEDAFVHHWGMAAFRTLGMARTFEIYAKNRAAFRQKWRGRAG